MIRAYVINLERARERREAISGQLEAKGVPFTVCSAVDGRLLEAAQRAACYDEEAARRAYRALSPGELGCALSHRAVYRRMLADGAGHALVLEDDAELGSGVAGVLAEIEGRVSPDEPAVILLSHVEKYTNWGRRPLGGHGKLVRRYGHWWRAHAYVVTRAAAQRLLDGLDPVWCAADFWSAFEKRGLVELRAVVPYCVGLSGLAEVSSLEENRSGLDAADKARRSLGYYLHRYLYQRLLHQVLVRPFLRVAKQRQGW